MQPPACRVRGIVAETTQIHMDYREGKGTARPLSQEKSTFTLAWTGFYCFSGHITLRMVLIYYAQVHFRWLHFTENKGEGVANYIIKRRIFANVKGKVVELVTLVLGRLNIDFRKLL